MTPEIAYTRFGRNALVTGLICHIAAIVVSTMSASGAVGFFHAVYPFSCLALAAGAFAEIRYRGGHPFRTWPFYLAAVISVFPVLGPLVVCYLVYGFPANGQKTSLNLPGFFHAFMKLRANVLIIFVLLILLFFLFAVMHSKSDPYFQRRAPHSRPPQSALFFVSEEKASRITLLIEESSC